MSGSNVSGPHYAFNIGSIDTFQQQLQEFNKDYGVRYSFKRQDNWGREVLQWVLFLGIDRHLDVRDAPHRWRRRTRWPIFNIGKSRAQVFEGGKSTNVTFNDVAGLDEAKEELQETWTS